MADPTPGPDTIETRADLGDGDAGVWEYWTGQEAIAEREERSWIKRARKIVKVYRDERPETAKNASQFAIFWSNVQTMKPAMYGRTPKPDVQRRFKDQDDVGRLASELLERSLTYNLDSQNGSDFDDVMEAVVEDRLLSGRGTARVVYVPTYGDPLADDGSEEAESDDLAEGAKDGGEALREVTDESVQLRYVFWEDYREGPSRTWRDVPWVRYRSTMAREELESRFGKKKGRAVNLDYAPSGTPEGAEGKPPPDMFKKAVVHEYWDKAKREVVWLAPGTPDIILDRKPDPLELPGFFPSPKPLLATVTNDKRIPVPDYVYYQDQAAELNRLTARIEKLTEALRVNGVYAGDEKAAIQRLFDPGQENKLIPVQDWQGLTDKGGLAGLISWVPIQQIAQTLIQLYDARDRIKQIIYEVTGIGDVMRGDTQPDETATAQRLKTNFVTRRVTPHQKQVARFARDCIRLMASVIAGHFSAETISRQTGYPQLDPVPPIPPLPGQPPMANGLGPVGGMV